MNYEHLSALMDDELPAAETTAAVADLLGAAPARQTWSRYHLIGDALRERAERRPVAALDLAAPQPSVATVTELPLPRRAAPRRSPMVGLGLAASLAVIAVTALLSPQTPDGSGQGNPLTATVVAVAPPTLPAPTGALRVTDDSQDVVSAAEPPDQRLDDYMGNFNEQRARRAAPGVHPYVHTVGYDAR